MSKILFLLALVSVMSLVVANDTPKTVLIPVADGIEEVELIAVADVLRRAGANVTIASAHTKKEIVTVNNIHMVADALLTEVTSQLFDMIVIPGGMDGAITLRDTPALITMLSDQKASKRFYAAVCAGPAVVLKPHHLLDGEHAIGYPGTLGDFEREEDKEKRVLVSHELITSRGPGTSLEFGLELARALYGEEVAANLKGAMVVDY